MHVNVLSITNVPHSGNATLSHGSSPGEVIHFDTFEVRRKDCQTHYVVAMVDPYTGGMWCPSVASKDKIADEVIKVIKMINRSFKTKRLYTDGGTEFINRTLKKYCNDNGIVLHYPPPRTPKWNGIAERAVRTIKDGARVLLANAGTNRSLFWYQAMKHFMYIWNRTYISRHTNTTPYEVYIKEEPSVNTVSVFGCDVYVWLHKDVRDEGTFASRGEPGIYLGHDAVQNCAIVWLLKSNKKIMTRAVDYRESQFNYIHALDIGTDAVGHVISRSDIDGDLSWNVSGDDDGKANSDILTDELKQTPTGAVDPDNTQSGTDDSVESDDNRYVVSAILDHKKSGDSCDGYQYQVRWKGYSDSDNTWELADNLLDGADEILNEYRVENGINGADYVGTDDVDGSSN